MAIEHLKQEEVYTSETTNDSLNLSTFAPLNIQDDLNVLRTVLKSIIGGANFKDIANIYTLKNLFSWRNTHFTATGLKATSIDLSVVTDVDNFNFVLSSNSYWQKLKSFAQQYLNSQNKVLWSGIAYTTTDINNAISLTPTINTIQTNISTLQATANSLQTNQGIFFQEIYGSVVSSSSGNQPILTRLSSLEAAISNLGNAQNLGSYINTISEEIYGYSPPPNATVGTNPILTRLNTLESNVSTIQSSVGQISQIQSDLTNLQNNIGSFTYNDYSNTINTINTNLSFLNFISKFGVKEKVFLNVGKLKVLDLDKTLRNFIENQSPQSIYILLRLLHENGVGEIFIPYRYLTLANNTTISSLTGKIDELLNIFLFSNNIEKLPKITIVLVLNKSTTQNEPTLYSMLPYISASLLPYFDVALQIEDNFFVWTDETFSSTTSVSLNDIYPQLENAIKHIYENDKPVKVITNNPKAVLSKFGNYSLEIFSPIQFYWPISVNNYSVKISDIKLIDNIFDVNHLCTQVPSDPSNPTLDNILCDFITMPTFQGISFDLTFDTTTNNYTSTQDVIKVLSASAENLDLITISDYASPYKVFSQISLDISDPLSPSIFFDSVKSGFYKLYRPVKLFNKDLNNFPTGEVDKHTLIDEYFNYYKLTATNNTAISYINGVKNVVLFSTSLGNNFEIVVAINGYSVYSQTYLNILKLVYDQTTDNLSGYDNSNNQIPGFSINLGTSGLGIFKLFFINDNTSLKLYLGSLSDISPQASSPQYVISNLNFDGSLNLLVNFTGSSELKIKVMTNNV